MCEGTDLACIEVQIYPEPKAGDIFDHKLSMTEVEGSILSE